MARHHGNWRIKALQRHDKLTQGELAYTAPISIRESDVPVIREMCAQFVERVLTIVRKSEPEERLMCLCLDWFEI